MLIKIPILTGIMFASIYPLCFWISARDPLKNNFHRFHLGLPCLISGILTAGVLTMDLGASIERLMLAWTASLLFVSYRSWHLEYPSPGFVSVPSLLGLAAFILIQGLWVGLSLALVWIGVLGGCILASAIFTMNLGHWYLNVHGLDINHLRRAAYVFWACVFIRAIWDIYFLIAGKIFYDDEMMTLLAFMFRMDGFFLLIALLFGTVFPLVALYFVKGTLDVKSTQSATGILFVILSAVLIGDLTYKYYLVKFGVIL